MKGLGGLGVRWDRGGTEQVIFAVTHNSFPNSLLEQLSLLGRKMLMKSRVLQFLCSIHTIYVELPQWNFFFQQGGQEGGDRNKPFKSSLREPHKDISSEQIREWICTVRILYGSGPQHGIQAPQGASGPLRGGIPGG